MSLSSGFFNSINGDRAYSAEQFSSIFDGIIRDGIFATIGKRFKVTSTDNILKVDTGRAWFNGVWIYNDSILIVQGGQAEILRDRIDALVIEINKSSSVRAGSIKLIKGIPSSTPRRPSMINSLEINTYPLAYIFRKAGATGIRQTDITNMIGTSECPYITGILQVADIDNIVEQWQAQWNDWKEEKFRECDVFKENLTSGLDEWKGSEKDKFVRWFDTVKNILNPNEIRNFTERLEPMVNIKIVTLSSANQISATESGGITTTTFSVTGIKSTDRPIISPYIPTLQEVNSSSTMIFDERLYLDFIKDMRVNNRKFKNIININTINNGIEVVSKGDIQGIILAIKGV